MEHLFRYKVTGRDCNGAGCEETWTAYQGFDRYEALEAKRECEGKAIAGYIHILVPGPKGWCDRREEEERKLADQMWHEAMEAHYEYMALHPDEFKAPKHEYSDEIPLEDLDEIFGLQSDPINNAWVI